jgi:prevent-host-death family protein
MSRFQAPLPATTATTALVTYATVTRKDQIVRYCEAVRTMTATEASRGFSEMLDAVERGETVAIVRGGRAVAVVSPPPPATGRALREALAGLPPLDDDLERDMALGMEPLDEGGDPWGDA